MYPTSNACVWISMKQVYNMQQSICNSMSLYWNRDKNTVTIWSRESTGNDDNTINISRQYTGQWNTEKCVIICQWPGKTMPQYHSTWCCFQMFQLKQYHQGIPAKGTCFDHIIDHIPSGICCTLILQSDWPSPTFLARLQPIRDQHEGNLT